MTVSRASGDLTQETPKEVTVDCPAGSKVVSGGFVVNNASVPTTWVTPSRSYAVDDDTWLVRANRIESATNTVWALTAIATCVS